jgi:hypothetical protein
MKSRFLVSAATLFCSSVFAQVTTPYQAITPINKVPVQPAPVTPVPTNQIGNMIKNTAEPVNNNPELASAKKQDLTSGTGAPQRANQSSQPERDPLVDTMKNTIGGYNK